MRFGGGYVRAFDWGHWHYAQSAPETNKASSVLGFELLPQLILHCSKVVASQGFGWVICGRRVRVVH